MPLFDIEKDKVSEIFERKIFLSPESIFYPLELLEAKLKMELGRLLLQLQENIDLSILKSSDVFDIFTPPLKHESININHPDFPYFLILKIKERLKENYLVFKDAMIIVFSRNHRIVSSLEQGDMNGYSSESSKDFFIPDLQVFYEFCKEIECNKITPFLCGDKTNIRKSKHISLVLDFIFGKNRTFLMVDPLLEVQSLAFLSPMDFKHLFYKDYLNFFLERYGMKKRNFLGGLNIPSLYSAKINNEKISVFKKSLIKMITHQFDEDFCNYETTASDFPRICFEKINVNDVLVVNIINNNRSDFSFPQKMQMLADDIKGRLKILDRKTFPFSLNFMRNNFIPALLMLSINQGAMMSFFHAFKSVLSVHLQKTLSPHLILDIKNTETEPHRISCSVSGELFKIAPLHLGFTDNFRFSFDYVINSVTKTIHIENVRIELSTLLEEMLSQVDSEILGGLDMHQSIFNTSNSKHWDRISKVAEWIQAGHLSLAMLHYEGKFLLRSAQPQITIADFQEKFPRQ